jgi:hypothetical protein
MTDDEIDDESYLDRLKAANVPDLKIREQIDFAVYQFEEAASKGNITLALRDLRSAVQVLALILGELDLRLIEIENRLGLAHRVQPIQKERNRRHLK